MQRSLLLILAFLPFMPPGPAQASEPVVTKARVPLSPENTDVVIARLMSFDSNGDGTIAAPELPERMQPIVMRGDADGNGAIDANEARALTRMPFPRSTSRAAILSSGTYGFVDDITLSSRSHVEGAIEDLRLPAGSREEVLAIASRFMDAHESAARTALLDELNGVLPPANLALFETSVDRALQGLMAQAPAAVAQSLPAAAGDVRVLRVLAFADGGRHLGMHVQTDLNRVVASQSLTPAQRAAADSAVTRFKEALRVDDAAREALIEQIGSRLDTESQEDLRAALGRRPVAPTGGRLFVSSTGHAAGRTGQVVVVPLVHRLER